ncbi:SpoIIE family protein phosphatase [bacterium]|nr:SpoIIE family protein phosphatase [bacterium]
MRDKVLNVLVSFVGLVVVAASLVIGVHDYSELFIWRVSGDLGTAVTRDTTTDIMTFNLVSESDVVEGAMPTIGDTVLTFNGLPATRENRNSIFIGPQEPGTKVDVEFRQHGETKKATFLFNVPRKGDFIMSAVMITLKYVINIAFLIVALIALIQQPASGAARMLILFNFAMAALIANSLDLASDTFTSVRLTQLKDLAESASNIIIPSFASFWLGLQTLFPRPIRLMERHPVLVYTFLFLPVAGLVLAVNVDWIPWSIFQIMLIGYVAAGFVVLGYNVSKTKDPVQKRQAKLVMWGTAVGLTPMFAAIVFFIIFPGFIKVLGLRGILVMLMFLFTAMLAVPITYLYAFNRYGLLEIEAKIRRGTRHVLITGVLLALLFGIVFGASELMARVLGVTDRTPVLILSVVLAVGVTPAQRRLQRWLDRRFFPERFKLRGLLDDFLQRASTLPDRESLWSSLSHELSSGLNAKKVLPLQRIKEGGFETLDHQAVPLDPEGLFYKTMLDERKPILLDEALQSNHIEFKDDELAWLQENEIEIIVPIIDSSTIQGILTLTGREGDDPYGAEEVRILASLARQIALTSENLLLLEDNVEKKRLEEQLAVARHIQQGFLPSTIPDTPGIEISATSLFCLEVAGDYYDVISLPGGRTLFAVGDVSGKGAGAAMIMANLQASLRALSRVEVPLTELVAGINDLIHHNTPPEDYITFFVGIFDPDSSKVTYVNAGHNPPFVFRKGGGRELLEAGGVILGSIPGMPYEEGEVVLTEGDLLLLFTDGVTEAMNETEEEFGEERLADTVLEHFSSPTVDLLSTIEDRVIDYTGDAHFADDFTLLILRRGSQDAEGAATGSGEV